MSSKLGVGRFGDKGWEAWTLGGWEERGFRQWAIGYGNSRAHEAWRENAGGLGRERL